MAITVVLSPLDASRLGMEYRANPQRDPIAELALFVCATLQHVANLGLDKYVLRSPLDAITPLAEFQDTSALHASVAPGIVWGELGKARFTMTLSDSGFNQGTSGFGLRGAREMLLDASPRSIRALGWYTAMLSTNSPDDLASLGRAAKAIEKVIRDGGIRPTQLRQAAAAVMAASLG